jgi:hypothetical protein
MSCVSHFENTATQILEAAECASEAGSTLSDFAILVSPSGGISMVADSGWSLAALQMERGAKMAYRISERNSIIKVEGRAGYRTCLFETTKPDGVARFLLSQSPQYLLAEDESKPTPRRAETLLIPPAASD